MQTFIRQSGVESSDNSRMSGYLRVNIGEGICTYSKEHLLDDYRCLILALLTFAGYLLVRELSSRHVVDQVAQTIGLEDHWTKSFPREVCFFEASTRTISLLSISVSQARTKHLSAVTQRGIRTYGYLLSLTGPCFALSSGLSEARSTFIHQ